jgi:Tfp pilus assembly protein PilN
MEPTTPQSASSTISPNQLSFLPEDYLERRSRQRANLLFAVLFLIVASGIIAAFVLDERESQRRAQLDAEVDRQYEDAARRIEQVRQLQEKQRHMAQQAELTASLLEKVPRSFILAETTNSMPAGVSLLDFGMEARRRAAAAPPAARTAVEQRREAARSQVASASTPEPVQYDVSMKLTGVAQTDVQVAQFMSRLQQSTLLQDVNLVYTEQSEMEGQQVRKFQMEMRLNPAANVQAMAPQRLRTAGIDIQR